MQRSRPRFETLETRRLLTATQPAFSDFSSVAGLQLNGSAVQSGSNLLLQTQDHQRGTAFWTQKLNIQQFSTQFDLQATAHAGVDDYYTFALQNGTDTALGADDIDSGYGNGTVPNQAAAISFTTENLGSGSGIQFLSGNGSPVFSSFVQMPNIDMSTTDTFRINASYDGTNLNVTVTDLNNTSDVYTTSHAINLPQVLGDTTAYAGFTVGSGSDNTYTSFKNWTYNQNTTTTPGAPTFGSGPSAVVAASGKSLTLSAVASTTDGSTITYSWADITKPSGAVTPAFGSGSSSTTSASLSKDGSYRFRVTATSSNGTSTSSDVSVVISQLPTRLLVEPHGVSVHRGKHYTFTASIVDQFNHALRTQPTIKFYVIRGSGKINYKTGVFTAGATAGSLEIEAKGGGLVGKALESIVA